MRSIRGQDDLDELGVLFDQVDYFSQRDWQHCATSTREKARLGFEAALRAYWEYVAKAGMEMTSNMFGLGSCLETVAATDFSNDIFADNFERAVKEKVLSVQEMIYVLVGAVAENEGLRRRLQPLAREIPDAVFSRAQTNRQLKLESHLFIELCRTLAKVWPDAYKTD